MAEIVDWSEVGGTRQSKNPNGGIRYLGLLDGCIHTVRFVGNPVRYFGYLINRRVVICGDPASCPVRVKYHIDPVERYAANVIDRDEPALEQRLKIVDLNPCVLRTVGAWARGHKGDPGGMTGCDFSIEAEGKGPRRRYNVTALDVTSFSEDEKACIERSLYDLTRIYRPVPPNEIEQRLFPRA